MLPVFRALGRIAAIAGDFVADRPWLGLVARAVIAALALALIVWAILFVLSEWST